MVFSVLRLGSLLSFPSQVVLRVRTSLQEKELQIHYAGTHKDPPDLSIISHKSRRARRRQHLQFLFLELIFTVLPHPVPGYKGTVEVWALDRKAKYEFEAIIVIFMLGRCDPCLFSTLDPQLSVVVIVYEQQ
jgi:hypothetical protein